MEDVTMRWGRTVVAVCLLLAGATGADAQPTASRGGRTALWTGIGAGAGFGVGLYAGLAAFDDAINSDRKVWTSAIVGAAAGGALAFLLTRQRTTGAPSLQGTRPVTPLDDRAIAQMARSVSIGAGTGQTGGDRVVACGRGDWEIPTSTSP
jgi:hypothetical protein